MAITWRHFCFFLLRACVCVCVCVSGGEREQKWMDGVNVWAIIRFDWLWVALSAGSIPTISLGPWEQWVVCLCMCACCHAFCVSMCVCVCVSGFLCTDTCPFDHIKSLYALQNYKTMAEHQGGWEDSETAIQLKDACCYCVTKQLPGVSLSKTLKPQIKGSCRNSNSFIFVYGKKKQGCHQRVHHMQFYSTKCPNKLYRTIK